MDNNLNNIDPQDIEHFISKFRTPETIKVFTEGCCYWFAHILYTRFTMTHKNPEIWYNEVIGHFATKIDGRLYDITGEIKDVDDKWFKWDEYLVTEPTYSMTIINGCILKN